MKAAKPKIKVRSQEPGGKSQKEEGKSQKKCFYKYEMLPKSKGSSMTAPVISYTY
ncbi:hypothetical protein [Microcoleus vaginatus]|uniref:hypothetical protein n=1 Tax=Microcoleus vaginatus TaxID=119532 RepID=UPI0032A469EF